MKIEIIEEKQNPLLHRKELILLIKDFNSTPKKEDIRKEASSMLGENTVLGSFIASFGKKELKCEAKVYESEEFMKKFEPKQKKKIKEQVKQESSAVEKK